MIRTLAFALAAVVGGCATAGTAVQPDAAPRTAPAPAPAPGTAPAVPQGSGTAAPQAASLRPFAELTRGAQQREGFFVTYEKGDQLLLAVPRERLYQDFLLTSKIAQGIGAAGIYGGTMLNLFEGNVVALERHGDRIFLVQRPHRFTAPEGSATERAVQLSFSSSVLQSAKIESVRVSDSDSTFLINVYPWFVSDMSNIGARVRAAVARPGGGPPNVSFDKDRSHLESVKAFPQNVNVRARLTFNPAQPISMNSVPDSRFIPVSVLYTIAQLPETPMEPREGDDRVGYFLTVRKDFSRDEREFFVRYVNRWRLEPGETAGNGRYYPKKPITYYLDRTIPEEYRPYMMEGILAWNQAFEAAGFQDAIRAEMLPDSADADDMRFPTLRWNTSDEPGYGAIGPSTVDPRTGEILDSDQLYEANMVSRFKRDWRTLSNPSRAIEEVFNASPEELEAMASGVKGAEWTAELGAQGTLLRALLAARGEIDASENVPMEYVAEALRWVTMHEVGHTLGLRHNFRSASDTPFDKLHDRDWVREHGLYSSVMEYPSVNVAPVGTPNGYVYTPVVGTYDRWAIAYGYTPDPTRAAAIARQAARAGHAYGTDEDARGAGALDPQVNVYQLSGDPLAWGKQRAELIQSLWADLPNHVLRDNARYADVTDAFNTLLVQYARALAVAPRYIGGQYVHRDRMGDDDARPPFVAVSRAEQRAALAFLLEYGFGEKAFAVPQSTLSQFGANRWSHWGETNTVDGRIDYPFHEQVLSLQASLLRQLTNPFVFARIRDAEHKFGSRAVLPIPELMEELTRSIWSEVWSGARNVGSLRRDLQRAYLDQMTTIIVNPSERMPADARSVARYRLRELDGRLSRALTSGATLDAYTRAHLAESRQRIAKVMEAGLEAERGR